jgi:16S rRNA (guanine527-N7)-methyltransferase
LSPEVSFGEMLDSELRSARLVLSPSIKQRLVRYCDELSRWNQKINLTGLRGVELVRRLVVEPIWIGEELKISGIVLDIGSGNGSPAIPLSIARKLDGIHLVEVRTRKAAFLRHVSNLLKVDGVQVHQGLFEDIAGEIAAADWVTLQAVMPTKDLCRIIGSICKAATNVVWITSGAPSLSSKQIVSEVVVPFTKSRAILLNLEGFV